jgi:quercetin dioxygenase-like cupin family protein
LAFAPYLLKTSRLKFPPTKTNQGGTRMTLCRFLTIAAVALPVAAFAQTATPPALHTTPPDAFVYQPAAEVEAMTHRTDGKPQSKIVIDHENYFIEYVTRVINTNAEAHNHWYDYIHVLDGEGSITYGGTQEGGTDAGLGEIRGGKLVGGKFQILHPGDRLAIPPGMPHIFTATPGHTFTYLIFKQKV